jgi:hypothetical protein
VVRCLPLQAAANCDGTYFGNYTVEVSWCGTFWVHVRTQGVRLSSRCCCRLK